MSAQITHRFVPVIFSALLASATSSTGLSAENPGQQSAAAANVVKGVPPLERILNAWQARQDRTKSLHVVYETAVRNRRGIGASRTVARSPFNVSRHELWIDADNRFRFDDFVLRAHRQAGGLPQPRSRLAFDGKTNWSLEWFENATAPSLATIWGPDGLRGLGRVPNALQLTFRPFSRLAGGRLPQEWRFVNENAILGNVHCVKIERSSGNGKVTEDSWVDSAREDVVVAWELLVRGRGRPETSEYLSIVSQPEAQHGWLPASWTDWTEKGLGPWEQVCTVIKLTLNEPFPAATFAPNIPRGTLTLDKQANRVEIAAAKNSAGGTSPSEQLPKVRRALDSKVDFEIKPQPLRDAIDTIRAHCQVPLKLDTAALNRAQIDDSSEVKANLKGRTLLEMLMSLFKDSPGQAGIIVKEGTVFVTAMPRVD